MQSPSDFILKKKYCITHYIYVRVYILVSLYVSIYNECTNACMYLLKQPPITHTHTKTTYWKLHSHQGNFNCLELKSLNFIIVQNWLVPNAMLICGKYIPYIYLPHLWHLRDVHPHSEYHFSQAADNKCLDVT